MSGVCALIDRDGGAIDGDRFAAAVAACRYRGPDRTGTWNGPGAALAHHALDTTPEARLERQPLVDPGSGAVLVVDGRVDNREELHRSLADGLPLPPAATTDADLVLAALVRWGVAGLDRLCGDFAGVFWMPATRTALCFRDHLGVRPLAYAVRGREVVVASTLVSVAAGSGTAPELNRELARDLLEWTFDRWHDETALAGVRRVPAGHVLVVTPGGVRVERYWRPAAIDGRVLSPGECVEQFRELFTEAVRCRLRADGRVGIAMSGGLDSSSVACVAHDLAGRGSATHASLYTRVYDETFPGADERDYQQAVAAACPGFAFVALDGRGRWSVVDADGDGERPHEEIRPDPMLGNNLELLRRVRHDSARVLLTGLGGDEVLNADAYHAPELLLGCGPRRVAEELQHFRRATGGSHVDLAVKAAREGAFAVLGPRQIVALRRLLPSRRRSRWLHPVPTAALGGRARTTWPRRPRWRVVRQVTSPWRSALLASNDLTAADCGVEMRHPFFDRRLVEWSVRAPAGLWYRDGVVKAPLRQAMRGVLPESVRNRRTRSYFTAVVAWSLQSRERERAESLLSALDSEHGLGFDLREYEIAWRAFMDGTEALTHRLLAPLYLARWLGAVGRAGPVVGVERKGR